VKSLNWFGIIIVYTVLTLLCVYLIPADSSLSALRVVVGFTFVAFVPGYCLVNFLFADGKLDFAEIAVLSVALSFSIAGISGLFLGLSPIGINVTSIAETLGFLTIVLAILALLRKVGLIKLPARKSRAKIPTQTTS
jgi:uncharacterized membrane protein